MRFSGIRSADLAGPWWADYRGVLERLGSGGIPTPAQLNRLLAPGSTSGGGEPLRFVPAAAMPGADYERHVYETGEVSTRAGSWHDVCNALAWCALPRLKAAINALHHAHLHEARGGRRGARRDALTLLDESGAIVVSRNRALLAALASRTWAEAFCDLRGAWRDEARTVICGHGLLEKLRSPYKSITAHALLLYDASPGGALRGDDFLPALDAAVAKRLLEGWCECPADLSPLPLMGIPGWWPDGDQDRRFYDDPAVFRPAPPGLRPAPTHTL